MRVTVQEEAPLEPTLPLEIHGFVSQGFINTTANNYLAESERGSFEFAEAGINFTKGLTDELRVGIQLFAHELGPLGNYSPQFDWFYLDYRFRDWFGIRAGRTKLPFGLYNETNDIDAARVPVLLPQSLYPAHHRDFLLAQTGAEAYGNVALGEVGTLEYRAYGGTFHTQPGAPPPPGVTVSDVSVPYVFGGRLMWMTPVDGLQIGGTAQKLRIDADYHLSPELLSVFQAIGLVPADVMGVLETEFRVTLWVASLEYAANDFLFSLEYGRWIGEFDSRAPLLLPPHVVNERYYGMVSYRVTPWFTPGIYYSAYYPNMEKRRGRENYQHDAALTLRYDLTANWLLKLESHYMKGTAGLEPSLNDGKERPDLSENWGVFLVKTTAYF